MSASHASPPPHWHTQRRQHPPHRTARERNGCASRQPDSEVHVRVSVFTLHTQQMLAHAVTVRRASEPGPCWHFSYIIPTSDMLSLGWRCRFRRASTSTRRRRSSYRTGCNISHSNRTGGHHRKTHIGTPSLSHITIVRSSVRPFRVGALCPWTIS